MVILARLTGKALEIVDVEPQHFKQSLIIRNIRSCAMGKEGKPKCINSQMSINSVRCFVETKSFRVLTRIASIFHRLRVNDD